MAGLNELDMSLECLNGLPRLAAVLDKDFVAGGHIGGQWYVSCQGHVVVDVAYGMGRPGVAMTPLTLMPWFSAGKPLTALAIALLCERGMLELDAPVCRWLPEFGSHGKSKVTLRHLLTHTGGFRQADRFDPTLPGRTHRVTAAHSRPMDAGSHEPSPAEQVRRLVERICGVSLEPGWIPGRKAGYHLAGSWYILGALVERVDGRSVDRFVREELLLPCGMDHAWLAMSPEQGLAQGDLMGVMQQTRMKPPQACGVEGTPASWSVCRPGSSSRGPIRELGRLYEVLLGQGVAPSGVRLLGEATVREFTGRQRQGMYDHTFQCAVDWGLGFVLNTPMPHGVVMPYGYGSHASPDTYGHSGSQSSCAFADPAHALVVAWVLNGMPGELGHQRRAWDVNTALYEDLGLVTPGTGL